ncbi:MULTISPECIES: hypothetical protein [Planococcus]|uniref:Uncharacterized protein n=1 Tax=Planococcus faecalis TaxID=1598147 RepID=A0ABN4XU56_9BACL|nr:MULTISPECIES: hypothetical protein [Planococcus]AQU80814.1 hypothetical protein AJGP001_16620 [Planococcus faecalis]MDJ0332274.1 hypothetical protein [Planococcus sp. S3-L1]OHX55799.1 hypothetical protein BB777_01195 [Planococcus faecalis]
MAYPLLKVDGVSSYFKEFILQSKPTEKKMVQKDFVRKEIKIRAMMFDPTSGCRRLTNLFQ